MSCSGHIISYWCLCLWGNQPEDYSLQYIQVSSIVGMFCKFGGGAPDGQALYWVCMLQHHCSSQWLVPSWHEIVVKVLCGPGPPFQSEVCSMCFQLWSSGFLAMATRCLAFCIPWVVALQPAVPSVGGFCPLLL